MSDIVNALHRLERAGSESGVATAKLIAAAHTVGAAVAAAVPTALRGIDFDGFDKSEMPRGYVVTHVGSLTFAGDDVLRPHFGFPSNSNSVTREDALRLAADVASGWLDEVADWLAERAGQDEAAVEALTGAAATVPL